MLIIACIDITGIDETQYRLLYDKASRERKARADRFYHIEDAKRCILGEAMLRCCYAKLFHGRQLPEITSSDFGKPYFLTEKEVHFNISHSGKWVVLAIADEEVGIDIELVEQQPDSLLREALTKEEYDWVCNSSNRQQLFIQYWTIKESYTKRLGKGLSIHPGSIAACEIQEKCEVTSILFDGAYYLSVCGSQKVDKMYELDFVPDMGEIVVTKDMTCLLPDKIK